MLRAVKGGPKAKLKLQVFCGSHLPWCAISTDNRDGAILSYLESDGRNAG